MKHLRLVEALSGDRKFSPCRGCGESYSGLEGYPAFGLCYDCQAEERAKRMAPSREPWLLSCGVPSRYCGEFSDAGLSVRANSALEWAANQDGEGLLLYGPTGSGKSYLAAEILWRMKMPGSRWVRAADAVGIEIGADNEARRELHRAPVLVIDDFGKGSSGNAWSILSALVCSRYENVKLRTVMTTNLGSADIPDPTLVDRLRDWKNILIAGKSRRGLLRGSQDSC